MNILRTQFSGALLVALLQVLFIPSAVHADLNLRLKNNFTFLKSSTTIEHLDRGNYDNTQVTSDWTLSNKVNSFNLVPEIIWTINSLNTYVRVEGNYGWIYDGRSNVYPFRWDLDGHAKGGAIEFGYLWDFNKIFTFIPQVGFVYNETDTKIKDQRFTHRNIGSFIRQNGNRSYTNVWYPYIGFEIDFATKICETDLQASFVYDVGYGGGRNKISVPFVRITDLASTSRFGSSIKYQDIINHDFEIALAYIPAKKWLFAITFDYNYFYNTHKLPVKLQRNKELVAKAQYTRSQYHRVSDYVSQAYSVYLEIGYSLYGDEGVYIH